MHSHASALPCTEGQVLRTCGRKAPHGTARKHCGRSAEARPAARLGAHRDLASPPRVQGIRSARHPHACTCPGSPQRAPSCPGRRRCMRAHCARPPDPPGCAPHPPQRPRVQPCMSTTALFPRAQPAMRSNTFIASTRPNRKCLSCMHRSAMGAPHSAEGRACARHRSPPVRPCAAAWRAPHAPARPPPRPPQAARPLQAPLLPRALAAPREERPVWRPRPRPTAAAWGRWARPRRRQPPPRACVPRRVSARGRASALRAWRGCNRVGLAVACGTWPPTPSAGAAR